MPQGNTAVRPRKAFTFYLTLNVTLLSLVVRTEAIADGRRGNSVRGARAFFVCLFVSFLSFAEFEALAGVANCVTSPGQG